MDMNVIEKIISVLNNMFSSFMSIEILLIVLLFFALILLNIKRNNLYVKVASSSIFGIFFLALFIGYFDYVGQCSTALIKLFLNLLYFPPAGIYFCYMILVSAFLIYNIFNRKIKVVFRYINIVMSGILYLFYLNFIGIVSYFKIDVADKAALYGNDIVLSFVQISNLLLLIWIISLIGYFIFLLFKKEDN